jgi:hypothetical protein
VIKFLRPLFCSARCHLSTELIAPLTRRCLYCGEVMEADYFESRERRRIVYRDRNGKECEIGDLP